MSYRTDLACEAEQRAFVGNKSFSGVKKVEEHYGIIKVTRIEITDDKGAKTLEKPIGNYITITRENGFDNSFENVYEVGKVLCGELKKICKKFTSVLVIGLGNEKITPDNLGVNVSKKIFATRHIKFSIPELLGENSTEVSTISTGVTAQTGLESAETVGAICEKIRPDLVIVVDALACGEIANLCQTIQVTDTGISPGSGVGNARKELSQKTLRVPVIAIGVPTVIDLETAVFQLSDAGNTSKEIATMMVTPRNIDKVMKICTEIIQIAVNLLLHPDLSPEEISSLVD